MDTCSFDGIGERGDKIRTLSTWICASLISEGTTQPTQDGRWVTSREQFAGQFDFCLCSEFHFVPPNKVVSFFSVSSSNVSWFKREKKCGWLEAEAH